MGYILPMRPLQYDTYHQRISKKEQGPFLVEKLQKIRHHNLSNQEYRFIGYTKNPVSHHSKPNHSQKITAQELFEFTGKGKIIDKKV
ncbi:hypothetical protein SAMN05421676_1153 [Salinibacillus kushneri]|uniref:Uncharacterized protein n=1 Tax=Salinibacillus kushneri TaxID=237682 RepID=A0A1I0J0V2_9BACI|nr:hypothetical protein [Salinibacillus kushneri]SEU02638.1 hypothetical protein SAMN05421676_1153 [Salinibacillus kushneri]